MLSEFTAEADIRGQRIDLAWIWTAAGDRPGLRLVRRRRLYPTGPEDGLLVLDLADLFREPATPWERVERTLYWVPSTPSTVHRLAETAQRQADVTLYFTTFEDAAPSQIVVGYYDTAAEAFEIVRLAEVSRMERSETSASPWAAAETLDIFVTPGGGPEQLAGQVVVYSGHEDGVTSNRLAWSAPGQPALAVDFDHRTAESYTAIVTATVADVFAAEIKMTQDGAPLREIVIDENFNPDSGDWKSRMTVRDMGLEAEVVYYYALFLHDRGVPGAFRTDAAWRVSAIATGTYGLEARLYQLLPGFYRYYDEPTRELAGKGQLRRFLEIFGRSLDQVRSLAEASRGRHDILNVQANVLPHLAHWIGWEPDLTLTELAQRRDILFAPELFDGVGTIPNIKALVNRLTGWECRVKEFVHNIFLTNAPEAIRLWEIWRLRSDDGVNWDMPERITYTDGLDGRPAVVRDSENVVWLFWHSDRSSRREIWLQRLDIDTAPQRAMLGAPDDGPDLTYADEDPVAIANGNQIWLFWSSNREGQWDIWTRVYDGLTSSAPVRLTDHPAEDRRPIVVPDAEYHIWLFWQSNRRGRTDIWVREYNGAEWGLPSRLTTAQFHDEMPAGVIDGDGRLWLFWSADLGDRRNLYAQVRENGDWSAPQMITCGPQRDEAPAAIFWNDRIWLFWHSNRNGQWQIWGLQISGQINDVEGWDPPIQVTTHPTADQQPAVMVDEGGGLRLYWQSQRRGALYRSRTIDTNDAEMLARLKTFDDRAHYSYDTEATHDDWYDEGQDWYARGVFGLYLVPDIEDEEFIQGQLERLKGFVEPFRPLPVRFVWQRLTSVNESVEEVINSDGLIGEEFSDEIKS